MLAGELLRSALSILVCAAQSTRQPLFVKWSAHASPLPSADRSCHRK